MSNGENIETRAQAAGAAVRSATATRSVPNVAAMTTAARTRPRPPIVWGAVVGIAAVAACVAVVVSVVGNDEREPLQPSSLSTSACRVMDTLPAGFEATGGVGPGTDVAPSEPQSIEVQTMSWITGLQPDQVAAVVPSLVGSEPTDIQSWLQDYTTGATPTDVDGHLAYLADSSEDGFDQVRLLLVQSGSDWIQVAARNVDDEALLTIARAALADDFTQASLPAGFAMIGQAAPLWMTGLLAGSPVLPAGTCLTAYHSATTVIVPEGSATNEDVIMLTSTVDVAMADAQLALYFPTRTPVPGTAYFRTDFPGGHEVNVLTWQVGGVSYLLLGTVSIDELVAAADSVRVPTDDEWDALVALAAANAAEQNDGTGSSVEVAPASTAVAVPETTGA